MVWSGPDGTIEWGVDPLAGFSFSAKNWLVRFDAWTGWLGGEWDFGMLASGSRSFGDTTRSSSRFGGMAKFSKSASSFIGGFCQWQRGMGDWTMEVRADLRLRREPTEISAETSTEIPDDSSITAELAATRAQALGRWLVLRRFPRWSVGPAFEIDARTSLSSDSWSGDALRGSAVRQDGFCSAGAVARLSPVPAGMGEVRVMWMQAFSNSDLDPEYVERNSGILLSVGTGFSF